MTDTEIIKALECCRHSFCCDCPYEKYSENCTDKLLAEAHRFVKHQREEIERLTEEINALNGNTEKYIAECEKRSREIAEDYRKEIKAEIIKEFADALKSKSELVAPSVYAVPYRAVSVEDIDKLVKIAGGEDNES